MIARALVAAVLLVGLPAPKGAAPAPRATVSAPKAAAPAPKIAPPAPKLPPPAPKAAPPAPKVAPKPVPPPPKVAPAPPKVSPAPPSVAVPPPKVAPPPPVVVAPTPSAPAHVEPPHAASAAAHAEPPHAPSAAPRAEPPPAPAAAAHAEPAPASLVIDLVPPEPGQAWFVSGLEQVVGNELLRFRAVELAQKIDPARCPGRAPRCLVDQYRAAGVDVVVLGKLEPRTALAYEVYETWAGTRAFAGSLQVSGVTTPALQRQIGEVVRPIVQRGGLLDHRPVAALPESATSTPFDPAPVPSLGSYLVPVVVAVAITLLALPILLALFLVGGTELGRRETPASWKWSALLVVSLSTIAVAEGLFDLPAILGRFAAHAPPIAGLLPPFAAGTLWGAFALAIAAWVFAPIRGLERLRHEQLWPVLRSWTLVALLRTAALLVLYAPVFALALHACAEAKLPGRVTLAFIVPTLGLLVHFWLLSLVDNLSVYLDFKLASWPPTSRNAWHATVKRYFGGYVRRNVIEIDEELIERTLFLPGVRPEVICYGGGFARPRIVIGEKALEAALGELPDEEEIPDRTVNPEELPVGFLVPSMGASDDHAQLGRAERWRHALGLLPARARAHVPRILGENATLLGWVLPQAAARTSRATNSIPLISDTEEDFGVVKRLLSEHYSAFVGILHGDEVDDTDPTQKDFLFGALLREIGVIARHDVLFATLRWSLVTIASGGWLTRPFGLPVTLYDRFLSAPAARVADAYAALNSGLHPLIQYLCFLRGKGHALLTARANVPQLLRASRAMVAELEREEPTPEEGHAYRATPRDRAAWLTRIFHGHVTAARIRWVRVLGAVVLGALASVLVLRSVSNAIAYHPTYVERLDRMKSQAAPSRDGQ